MEQETLDSVETSANRSIAADMVTVFGGSHAGPLLSALVLALFAILAVRILLPIIFVLVPASISILIDTVIRWLIFVGKLFRWLVDRTITSADTGRGKLNHADTKSRQPRVPIRLQRSWRVYYGVMGQPWIRRQIRSLVRFGAGWKGSFSTPFLLVLISAWAAYGVFIHWNGVWNGLVPVFRDVSELPSALHHLMENIVRYIATLTPTVMTFTSPDSFEPSIRLAHYLGSLIFLWGALPPLLALLIRTLEGFVTAHLASRHYVVIGLGSAGSALATSLLKDPRNLVIAIEADSSREALHDLRKAGCIIFERDATRIGLKAELSLHRARGIFITLGDDSLNLDIAGRIANQVSATLRKDGRASVFQHPKIIPHVNDLALRQRLSRNEGLFVKPPDEDGFTILPRPFSTDEMSVRLLLHGQLRAEEDCDARCSRETLTGYARLLDAPGVHAVILGFDNAAETLVTELLQFALAPGLDPPRITIVIDDPASENTKEHTTKVTDTKAAFLRRFPAVKTPEFDKRIQFLGADLTTIHECLIDRVENETAKAQREALLQWLSGKAGVEPDLDAIPATDDVTAIFVCLENDGETLSAGLALQSLSDKTHRWQAPIFLRLRRDAGLKNILRDPDRTREINNVIYDFGQDHLVCSADVVFNRPDQPAARAAHSIYQVTDAAFRAIAARKAVAELEAARESGAPLKAAKDARKAAQEALDRAIVAEKAMKAPRDKASAAISGSQIVREEQNADTNVASNERRANKPWEQLTKDFVVSNISQALHARTKLEALGFRAFELPSKCRPEPGIHSNGFAAFDQVECVLDALGSMSISERNQVSGNTPFLPLAYVEHERFNAERTVLGWVYGEERNNQRRIHNLMKDFEKLDADDQFRDISTAVFLPYIARELRPETLWKPEIRIGLVGSGLVESLSDAQKKTIADALDKLLVIFAESHSDWLSPISNTSFGDPDLIVPVLISTLAPGADFLLASAATDHFFNRAASQSPFAPPVPRLLVPRPFSYGDDHPDRRDPDNGLEDDASCDALPPDWFLSQKVHPNQPDSTRASVYRHRRTDLIGRFGSKEHPASDEWIVDLMPPGTGYQHCRIRPGSSSSMSDEAKKRRETFRSSQIKRATHYIRQRADWTLVLEASPTCKTQDDMARDDAIKSNLPPIRNATSRLPDIERPFLEIGSDVEVPPGVHVCHKNDKRMTLITHQQGRGDDVGVR